MGLRRIPHGPKRIISRDLASAGLATRSASLGVMLSCRPSGSSSRCSLVSPTRTLGVGRIPRWSEAVTLCHRSAVWIGGEVDGGAAVLTRAGASAYWYVWGWLARSDLLRLAASLPVD